jgi:hypothetical protein
METTKDFKVGDMVVFIPNGLVFRCENMKQWKWMQDSGNYIKTLSDQPVKKHFRKSEEKNT